MPTVGQTHHLKLGNEYLIIRPNSYTKRPAPTFGARIATGDPDYNNLSIWQHWVQSCWVGGVGESEWVDDAMYHKGVGINVTEHERATLARDLWQPATPATYKWDTEGAASAGDFRFHVFNGRLYCVWIGDGTVVSRLYRFDGSLPGWERVTIGVANFVINAIANFDGKLFIAGYNLSNGNPLLRYTAGTGLSPTWSANPDAHLGAVDTKKITAMAVYAQKLYIAYGTSIVRMKDDQKWDGNTVFYKVNQNSGSNAIIQFETHLGFLYMLSSNGHIHRTDGNNSFDIWSWDGQTNGTGLRSYDGKLFVTTYEYAENSSKGVGVIYQFTGSAVTELKRFGDPDRATRTGRMLVWNRKLYYGAGNLFGYQNGFGVACYDAAEDGHSIFAANTDTATTYPDASGTGDDWFVSDLVVFGKYMYVSVKKFGIFRVPITPIATNLTYKTDATAANGGWITSSMYNAGTPGLLKLWRKATVFIDLPTSDAKFKLQYSTVEGDGGWTDCSTEQSGPSPADGQYVFYLNNVISTRMRYRIWMRTTNSTVTPVLRGVVFAYLPQPEPNWMWSFTIPVTDKWELMDDTTEVKNTATLIAYLDTLYRTQQLVSFTDADGSVWATNGPGVLVYDYQVVYYDITNPREADVRVTLLEAVESY